nr:MAG TPA: hypothetical protein [Caudoviricetes sp.]
MRAYGSLNEPPNPIVGGVSVERYTRASFIKTTEANSDWIWQERGCHGCYC